MEEITVQDFVDGIFHNIPEGAAPVAAGFSADPKAQRPRGAAPDPTKWADWRTHPIHGKLPKCLSDEYNNTFLSLSSLRPDEQGRYRAAQKYTAALHAVMVDDLGNGTGSKGSIDGLKLEPSWQMETSPGNYQVGYILQDPVTDAADAKALADGISSATGGDQGAKNAVRWFRAVGGVNSKASVVREHGEPFRSCLWKWNPDLKYAAQAVAEAHNIKLPDMGEIKPNELKEPSPPTTDDPLATWLGESGYLTGEVSGDGWLKFNACPWTHEHTDQDPSGAAYGPPGTGTGDDGQPLPVARFKCHHGHCASRKLPQLIEWSVNEGYPLPDDQIQYATTEMLKGMIANVIGETTEDDGACYEHRSLLILKALRKHSFPDYRRARTRLKSANKAVSVVELDKAVDAVSLGKDDLETATSPDHLEIAKRVIAYVGVKQMLYALSSFWRWQDTGVWSRVDDFYIKQSIHEIMQLKYPFEPVTANRTGGVLDAAKTECFVQDHEFNLDKDRINVLNGELVRIDGAWVLLPHDREQFRTTQLPVKYDPGAQAPKFWTFLHQIFEPDAEEEAKVQLVLELIGYTLVSHCRFEKFVIMIGLGANGKSVLLAVIEGLVGRRNIAAVQPSQFDNKFQRAHLQDKLANIVSELKEGVVIDDNALKAITSGEVSTVEHKHKAPFDMHPFATCWFGANHLPHTRDFSDALFRRAMVIPFNRVFKESEQDKRLKDGLQNELSGVLNLALDAFGRVVQRGEFTYVAEVEKAKNDWRTEADQVTAFVEEECEITPSGSISSRELYQNYTLWASEEGITRLVSQKGLVQRLKRLGITAKKANGVRKLNGIRERETGCDDSEDVINVTEQCNKRRGRSATYNGEPLRI